MMIIFSDVDGLYTKNPKISKDVKLIKEIKNIDQKIEKIATKSIGQHGTGGMKTKIDAAKICQTSGCVMAIANGLSVRPIKKILDQNICTWFLPKISKLDARKKWIISSISPKGELIVDEGDPYSALLVNKSLNNIRARGIFDTVKENITEGSSPDLKVLEISVTEKATGEITAGAGVGTDGTAFMASISENNWLGRGIKLQSSLDVTEETISGAIAVVNPNYNYSGNAVKASLDISSSDKTANSGYKSSKTGFSLGTDFEQYQNVFISPEIEVSFEDIEAESSASTRLKKMEGNYSNIDFVYGIAYDKRNQTWQPTDGFRTKFIQSLPIIQDGSSILNGFDVSAYHEVNENIVGAVKFYARAIHGMNDEDVRLTSRLFIPQHRLRGFNTVKVGPKDREDYIGGNYVSTLQFEAQLPKLLPESTRTDVSVFLDTGNVWAVDYDSSLDETNKIRSAIGVSANVFTTIGPLSFTLAQDLSKATNDDSQLFNFRLGTSF